MAASTQPAAQANAPTDGDNPTPQADKAKASAAPRPAPEPETPARLAVAYSPQVMDPETLSQVGGGNFVVSLNPGSNEFLVIRPGLNLNIDPDQWAQAQSLPAVQRLFGLRALEEFQVCVSNINDRQTLADVDLSRTGNAEALRLVYLCRDAERLRQWARTEDRPAIRNAAVTRAEQIEQGMAA